MAKKCANAVIPRRNLSPYRTLQLLHLRDDAYLRVLRFDLRLVETGNHRRRSVRSRLDDLRGADLDLWRRIVPLLLRLLSRLEELDFVTGFYLAGRQRKQ